MITLYPISISPDELRYSIRRNGVHTGGITVLPIGPHSFTYGIAVARECRRQGIARAALLLLFEEMKKRGFELAIPRVHNQNTASLALHGSLGFETVQHLGSICILNRRLSLKTKASLYEQVLSRHVFLSVYPLNDAGIEFAQAFSSCCDVIAYIPGPDSARPISDGQGSFRMTHELDPLRKARFHIVPVQMDDSELISLCRSLGSVLSADSIIVFESIPHPAAVLRKCIPALEDASGLRCGHDFTVGYTIRRTHRSPAFQDSIERKKVACLTPEGQEEIRNLYNLIFSGGTESVPCLLS